MMSTPGTLYIVATPIGNLQDITLRALEVLKKVDKILAEDTRHSRPLLDHYGIHKPLIAYHEHNERELTAKLLEDLKNGQHLAQISDAGTPLISDPGFYLVQQARQQGIPIVSIPGPSALIAALSIAGLPTDQFCFLGFLPAKAPARRTQLKEYSSWPMTLVFYEAPHRILDLLQDIAAIFPHRQLALAKELTKQFENLVSGTAQEVLNWLQEDPKRQKGEFVLVVEGHSQVQKISSTELTLSLESLLQTLGTHLSTKDAALIAAQLTGRSKKELYNQLAQLAQTKT